ncbi:AraC family transcriptional regulator [Vibrio penaeicida]|uniref:AraC family transcriptional regulator n=2 Tax=Vibrio penaeicida TaxID=104609 RepID=A0AAV5NQN2_9VIBR|nr:AraC family transcriptional regulator [Vibrio penaeicida]RTZ23218.1 AraC family transcriptional regulator [Vibrio penaeicida]GLQ72930.1 AraC family transcriptional regulator [Vibrio penaeicida]
MELNKSEYSLIDAYDGIEFVSTVYGRQPFPLHHHEGYAIGMLDQGVQRFGMNGNNYKSSSDQLVIINADTSHTGEAVGHTLCSYKAIYPTPEQIQSILKDTPHAKYGCPFISDPIVTDSRTSHFFRMSLQEINQPTSRLCLETLLYGFVLSLLVNQSGIGVFKRVPEASPNIKKAMDYIQSFYDKNISLDELSFVSNLDKNTLITEFKRLLQTTPHQYLIQVRVNKAKQLLRKNQKLSHIAFKCGFSDQSHFTRCFKQFTSVTPNMYRKSILSYI